MHGKGALHRGTFPPLGGALTVLTALKAPSARSPYHSITQVASNKSL